MQRQPVDSTSVISVGYDEATQTLEIEFTGGAVYQYFDVPVAVFEALIGAGSAGQFLNQQIKGVYRYAKA